MPPKRETRSSKSSQTRKVTEDENSSMASSSKMKLKLLVDRKGSRVLFAEAPKEFVDFLFHIFSLPLGTLIELLGSKQMVGCLGKLKRSIQCFHEDYLQPGIEMDDVFNPKTAFRGDTFLLSCDGLSEDQSGASREVYRCSKAGNRCSYCSNSTCRSNATVHVNSICPSCGGSMNVPMTLIMPKEVDKKNTCGYVKEMVTYMVMDDLVVKPMSTISSITLLNKFGVKDLSQLEEKVVSFGKDQGLKLLKASLKTDKVLTSIFMH